MPGGGVQGEFIPVCAETKQAAACDITEIALVPKILPGKRIAQVNFDERDLNGQQGIPQGHACMREGARVQDNEFDLIVGGLLDTVNEFVFGIALKAVELASKLPGKINAALLNVGKGGYTVDIGFAGSEQIQVRTIDEQQ